MKSVFCVLATSVLLWPSLGQAQDDDPSILVEGQRVEEAPSTTQSVRAITEAQDGNVARFESPVCPAVGGLPTRLASVVVDLMRKAVATADVDLAAENCHANLTLIVTDDGQELIAGLAKAHSKMFGERSALEMEALRDNAGPSWSWHVTQPKRADGSPVTGDGSGSVSGIVVRGATMSRLSSPIRQEIDAGFVVLDVNSIDGLSLKQIADFAVMRGLVATRGANDARFGFDSILNLFGPGNTMEGLTPFDREYLASVYRGGNGFTYNQKTKQIAQDVKRSEQAANPDAGAKNEP